MTAFLSVILAFMNTLPIPALDGGHVMFLIYEVVSRRKPNEKFMEYAQVAVWCYYWDWYCMPTGWTWYEQFLINNEEK